MTRMEALRLVAERLRPEWLVVVCNGMIGRELWTIGDRPNHFYMIGSMGLASTIGLGLALRQPDKKVVVLDGDGNVLMNMGALGNVAQLAPANLYHVVLDNGVHGSTGGQRTISDSVALEAVARACGYREAARVSDESELRAALDSVFDRPGPAMLLAKVEATANQHGIARVEIEPPALAERFRAVATA
jgi:sulfopyruvate decarboxylase subunit beta